MKKYLLLISIFLLIPCMVHAENNATINIKSSKENVSVQDIITVTITIDSNTPIGYYSYTLDYNPNKLKLLSPSSYIVNRTNESNTKKIKQDFKFKIKEKGTSKISVKSYTVTSFSDEKKINIKTEPITISTENILSNPSDNNYLSKLKIEGYEITPKFNKKTLNYKLDLKDDTDTINIIAKPENNKSTVSGDGEISLLEGDNKIEILVTSESGKENIYTIIVTTDDKNKINITINNEEYTLIKNLKNLNIPEGYKITKIKINDKETDALYSSITNFTLIGLKDKNDNIELYIYDQKNNSYLPYNYITLENISILPIKTNKTLENYQTYNVTINKTDIECYKLSSSSDYSIIYGMNLKNGEKGWYSYNEKEQSIQKYNDELLNINKEKIKNSKILIYILSGTTLLFGITTIALAIKKTKNYK